MHHEPPWTKKLRRIVATIHPSRAMSKLIFYPIAVEQAALVQHRACETAKAMDRRLPPQPHAIEDVEHMVSGDSSRLGRLPGAQIAPDFPVELGRASCRERVCRYV